MMKKTLLLIMVILATAFYSVPADAEDLLWVGCGITKKAYMNALAAGYEKKTGNHIEIEGGGATRGIRDVAAEKADIGGSCRHTLPIPEEKNVRLEHVAWDALVIIVHPGNPVSDVSFSDVKAIFTGDITNWKEVGGPDLPIKVVVRKGKVSGVGLMARELFFKDREIDFTSDATYLKSSGPVEKYVEKNRDAIAITGVSSAKKRRVKMMSLNGKAPTEENISQGDYILYRPLYLVTSKHPSPAVSKFIKYAKSEEGQAIIKGQGTVNLKDGAGLWKPYREAMRDMLASD